MKQIPLTHGKYAMVDDEDYERLAQVNWWAWHSTLGNRLWYAVRKSNGKRILMHREVMGFPSKEIDHRDLDGLNNQRSNLRAVTKSQQRMNQGKYKNNASGFKGVYAEGERWRGQIRANGKVIRLGRFENKVDAALAYNAAAQKYHGQFARLNEV